MSGGPGFSVSEIVTAIQKCRDIYNAFKHQYENAPAKIKELVDTCGYLGDVLEDLKQLFEYHRDIYPQHNSFSHKLAECQSFIDSYGPLKENYLRSIGQVTFTSKIRDGWETAWKTGRFAFEGDKVRDLKDGISLEIQKLVLFILVFSLKRNSPSHLASSNQVANIARDPEKPEGNSDFDNLYRQLQSVGYSYEREMSIAVQRDRSPNLEGVYNELSSLWHNLCVRAGLAQRGGPAPPLPRERLLEAPSRNLNDLIITLAEPSIHTELRPGSSRPRHPPSSRISSRSDRGSISSPYSPILAYSTANTTPSTNRGRQGTSGSVDLSEPIIPSHIATIELYFPEVHEEMSLQRWECYNVEDGSHYIKWTGVDPSKILFHHVPPNVFPGTLHSEHENEELCITFQAPHKMVLQVNGGKPYEEKFLPVYKFFNPEARERFQEDLRGKDLIEVLYFQIIWSHRNPRRNGGEALLQDLKFWQERQPNQQYSLSFYASTKLRRHVEFPLLLFKHLARRETNVVFLDFIRRNVSVGSIGEGSIAGSPRENSHVAELGTGTRASTEEQIPSRSVIRRMSQLVGISPPNDSSLSSRSRSSFGSDMSDYISTEDIPNHFRYLAIEFRSKDEATEFERSFNHWRDANETATMGAPFVSQTSSELGNASPMDNRQPALSPTEMFSPHSSAEIAGTSPIVRQSSEIRRDDQVTNPIATPPHAPVPRTSPQIPELDFQSTMNRFSWF